MRELYFKRLDIALTEMQRIAMRQREFVLVQEESEERIEFWAYQLYLSCGKTIQIHAIQTYLRRVAEATEIERFGRPWIKG